MGWCQILDKRFWLISSAVGSAYVATIFVIIGLCTNYWIELRNRNLYDEDIMAHFGLHRVCWVANDRCNNPGNNYDQQNGLPAVQGLVITGGFLAAIASIVTLINLFFDRLGRTTGVISASAAAVCAVAGIIVLVGVIYFGARIKVHTEYITIGHKQYQGASFGLTVCASGLLLIGAVLNGFAGMIEVSPKFNM